MFDPVAFSFPEPRVKLVCALTCDIERNTSKKSGFQAMDRHPQSQERLFGQVRLAGFAAMLKTGYAQEIVFLGKKQDGEIFQQGDAIGEILVKDYGAPSGRTSSADAGYGTNEAAKYIRKITDERGIDLSQVVVSTSHYHLPRTQVLLQAQDLLLAAVPAEALHLLENTYIDGTLRSGVAAELIEYFGGGDYAQRTVSELIGASRMIGDIYKPQGSKMAA